MSVVKSKRSLSKMEFVDNAEKLEVYTITHCAKFPKKYTFTLSNEIVGYTREIYNNVCSANEYPNSIEDYKRRAKLFAYTVELLKKVVRQLRIADQIFGIKATVMKDWMDLIDKELRLVSGIICSDREIMKALLKNN